MWSFNFFPLPFTAWRATTAAASVTPVLIFIASCNGVRENGIATGIFSCASGSSTSLQDPASRKAKPIQSKMLVQCRVVRNGEQDNPRKLRHDQRREEPKTNKRLDNLCTLPKLYNKDSKIPTILGQPLNQHHYVHMYMHTAM